MTSKPGSVVFAGGGSGGHLFPALAVATEVQQLRPEVQLVFLCGNRPIDAALAPHLSRECHQLNVPSGRDLLRRPWRSIPAYCSAISQAGRVLQDHPRAVVVGTGGYVSLPVGIAAWRRRCPLALIEPNAVPGRATSLLSPLAREIYTGWPETYAARSKVIVTGVPLRSEMAQLSSRFAERTTPLLLILGGSQGASEVNRLMHEILLEQPQLFAGWDVIHQTGVSDADTLRSVYRDSPLPIRVEAFIENMAKVLPSVSLVVSRSGANTLAELACAGVPAILLPHRTAVRQHQLRNAQQLENTGGARIVVGKTYEMLKDSLIRELAVVTQSPETRQQMGANMRSLARPDAARIIARRVVQILDQQS